MTSTRRSQQLAAAFDRLRNDGWAVAHDVLTTQELSLVRAEAESLLPEIYWNEGHRHALPPETFTGNPTIDYVKLHDTAAWQKANIGVESPLLFSLAFDDSILTAVEKYFADTALIGPSLLSAKFPKGGDGFQQGFHLDPLYSVFATAATPSLRMWVYLNDIDTDNGPTEFMPGTGGDDLNCFPDITADFSGYYNPEDLPDAAPTSVLATAPAGSILFYQARSHHRGTRITGTRCRVLAQYSYRAASWQWLSISWDHIRRGQPIRPNFGKLSLSARDALGFPPVGAPHWRDERAITEAKLIYPDLDIESYRLS